MRAWNDRWGEDDVARGKPERSVNMDALIVRDDFFEDAEQHSDTHELRITDLEPGLTFSRLRKPDFQRETANWTPEQVIDLIETFCAGDIIPSIILWESGARIFVIDGAHRLSALIGWINNDFGAGKLSQVVYGSRITAHQQRMHDTTMSLITASGGVGLWDEYKKSRPAMTMKTLHVQWIKGRTAAQAAKAFIRINQGGTDIDPLEERILRAARSGLSVATRAIVRGGAGHPYWQHFSSADAKRDTPRLGEEVHGLLYTPALELPIKTVELPLAGAAHGPQALRLAFDLVTTANALTTLDSTRKAPNEVLPPDQIGDDTKNYLHRTRSVVRRVLSSDPSSFGLHPALWFYNGNGAFQPAALLNVITWLADLDKRNKLHTFRRLRGRFEDLILDHPTIIKPPTNKLGSGKRTRKRMIAVLDRALELLEAHDHNDVVWDLLSQDHKSLRRDEEEEQDAATRGAAGAAFSMSVKNAATLADLKSVPRCKLCNGLKHPNGITLDHTIKKADGGIASVHNSRWVHPFCNSSREMDEPKTDRAA